MSGRRNLKIWLGLAVFLLAIQVTGRVYAGSVVGWGMEVIDSNANFVAFDNAAVFARTSSVYDATLGAV